jgi:hypothetical protein
MTVFNNILVVIFFFLKLLILIYTSNEWIVNLIIDLVLFYVYIILNYYKELKKNIYLILTFNKYEYGKSHYNLSYFINILMVINIDNYLYKFYSILLLYYLTLLGNRIGPYNKLSQFDYTKLKKKCSKFKSSNTNTKDNILFKTFLKYKKLCKTDKSDTIYKNNYYIYIYLFINIILCLILFESTEQFDYDLKLTYIFNYTFILFFTNILFDNIINNEKTYNLILYTIITYNLNSNILSIFILLIFIMVYNSSNIIEGKIKKKINNLKKHTDLSFDKKK